MSVQGQSVSGDKRSVDYGEYRERTNIYATGRLDLAKKRMAKFIIHDLLYGVLLYPWGIFRHRALREQARRSQEHTYTCFYRSPAQIQAITGPVLNFVLPDAESNRARLTILIFACSNGAEVYTITSELIHRHPKLDLQVIASDLHVEMIDRAREASYTRDEVWHSEYVSDEFVARTFDVVGERFVVKPHIKSKVTLTQANLLDECLADKFSKADLVFAQNVLFHLEPAQARAAFSNILGMLKPRAALLIEGIDLDIKINVTRNARLRPMRDFCKEIYKQARVHVPLAWWKYYYGSEPWMPLRRDRFRRYGSIFLRP